MKRAAAGAVLVSALFTACASGPFAWPPFKRGATASLERAEHLTEKGQYHDAVAAYDDFLARHPNDPQTPRALANRDALVGYLAARAELTRVRQDLTARDAEVARLREELAARPAAAEEGEEEGDDAHRRMYERISRELESERAAVSRLRRELDEKTAETAEHRRHAASGATNGVHITTEEAPVAATPAGRAGRRAAAVLASRAEADARAPYRRAEAARAAAAQRVPEHEQSAAGVWIARVAAIALVALLLIALAIIVSSLV